MNLGDRKIDTSKTTSGVVVAAGSVWDSRMKVDQVKGGIKVFNGDDDNNPQQIVEQNTSTTGTSTNTNTNTEIQVYKKQGIVGKRKTWKTENSKNGVDQKTPIPIARKRSELGKEMSVSVKKSSPNKVADGIKKTPRKWRSAGVNGEFSSPVNRIDRNAHKEVLDEFSDIDKEVLDSRGVKKSPSTDVAKIGSCADDDCQDKVITRDLGSGSQVKSSPAKLLLTYDNEDQGDFVGECVDDVLEEIEKTSFDVKEVSSVTEHKAKKIVIEESKIQQGNVKSAPFSSVMKKQLPAVVNNPIIVLKNKKSKLVPCADEFPRTPKKHSKLQSLEDLVMWRDVSRSAFIFGLGTFIIISSSYTTDINISLVTVLSYLGLVYLAAIFLFRAIICRGAIAEDDMSQEHVVGEEEAIWLLKVVLPYLNEFLLNLRALFSGDPATTMKLAVLLFVLARCGSSITIWKMAKLAFFGVFTVPKICSSYSSQLTAFGTFWIQRFKDVWKSCSHKKSVGFFIFTVMWNLSSIIARIWTVFMLFAAFKYYQQQYSLMNEENCVAEEEATGESVDVKMGVPTRQGPRHGPTKNDIN